MIELMKFDMGGCAAVLGCAKAIAQLRPVVRILLIHHSGGRVFNYPMSLNRIWRFISSQQYVRTWSHLMR